MATPPARPAAGTDHPAPCRLRDPTAGIRAGVCLAIGLILAGLLVVLGLAAMAPLAGWVAAVGTFLVWVWTPIWHADATRTAELAVREDASRAATDVALILAAVLSLVGVGDVIVLGANRAGVGPGPALTLAISSVVASWALVHTIFALRYARLYYLGPDGGIDFNQEQPPRYTDFAYLAFTIGMTFQVSDTDLRSSEIRSTALRQALLSYLLGAVIIAVTINLVAGLAK